MEKESCNCFTCRHKDEPRVISGYLQGYIEASDWFINWAEKNKIKLGSIADDDLGGIYAQMKCNRDESGCLLEEFPDLENKTGKIEEFTLQQVIDNQERVIKEQKEDIERLQAQLNKEIHYNRIMKRALEKYAFETTKMEVPKFVGNCLQPQNEADLHSPLVDKPVYDGVEEVEFPYANDTSLALQVLKEIDNKE